MIDLANATDSKSNRVSTKSFQSLRSLKRKLKYYIVNDWNSIDVVNIVMLAVWMAYRILNYMDSVDIRDQIEGLDLRPDVNADGRKVYVNVAGAAFQSLVEYNWVAAVMILYWYAQFLPSFFDSLSLLLNVDWV